MARLLKPEQAKRLGLPGRTSLEPVSGEIGSRVTFRIAEIAVPRPGDAARGPHLHDGFEECIYVLKGTGITVAESGEIPIGAWADLVVFDPLRVSDTATYDDPHRYPSGIEHVVVNGGVALDTGETTPERHGRFLRHGRDLGGA